MHVESCRVCGTSDLVPFLDLGPTALANSFLDPQRLPAQEPTFPLRLVLCEACGLVQIDEEVPPEVLFKDYIYVSGTSDLVHRHAAALARGFVDRFGFDERSLVVEAASNDGTVLAAFQRLGTRVLGVEPAANIVEHAVAAEVPTVCAFFNRDSARKLRAAHGPASLVLGRHVLAHVADLHGFVGGMHDLLADEGVAAVEVPHLLPFFERLEYDTIYHEHLCYFSTRVLRTLFEQHDLELLDVAEVPVHGGSIVVTAQRRGGPHWPNDSVEEIIEREEAAGLHRLEAWQEFAGRVDEARTALRCEVDKLLAEGLRVAGYGAPAKGMTLLAASGIGRDRIPYLVDRSPDKQGLLTPGHRLPVYAPGKLLDDQPDVVVLLAWNFADEIVSQQDEYLRRGGRFLLPLPIPHFWDERAAVELSRTASR